MDVFQQLMEYESQKKEKHLWEGEKAVLIWAGSDQHQHLGSAIDVDHVKNALEYCVEKGFMAEAEKNRLSGSVSHILESVSVHEFGSPKSNPAHRIDMVINRNGILAGEILIETMNLQNTKYYKKWSWDWFLLYYLAGLLLAVQTLKVLLDLVKGLSSYF